MKKIVLILALALVAVFSFTACNRGEEIHLFNWGLFIEPAIFELFYEEYGIRVIESNYSTNDEMHALVAVQGAEFDIIVPSDYMVERMINEGLLARINWDNIPNSRYIGPQFMSMAFDPQNLYSVPYKWGTFGIVYNTRRVNQVVDSWTILWDEQFAGEIFMYNSSRCTIGAIQRMLGFSMNSRDHGELMQVRDALIAQAPLVRAFQADQNIFSMIAEEGLLAMMYNGCARWVIYYNPDHNFVVPREGSQLWFNSMVIPANARNHPGAEKFINFVNRPEIAYMNTRYTRYSTTNMGAFARLPEDWQNCPIYWPDDEILARGEVFVDLGDFRGAFEQAWVEILLSSQN